MSPRHTIGRYLECSMPAPHRTALDTKPKPPSHVLALWEVCLLPQFFPHSATWLQDIASLLSPQTTAPMCPRTGAPHWQRIDRAVIFVVPFSDPW